MSVPTSNPTIPAETNEPQYPVTKLALFRNYTRVSYFAAFGVQPPPYDTSRPTKTWFDSSQAGKEGSVTYSVIANGSTEVTTLTMTCAEAASVNLEGDYSYPAYVPPSNQTVAVQGLPGTQPQPINAVLICEEADAAEIAKELGVDPPVNDEANQWPDQVDWRTETRRPWAITVRGTKYLCSGLIAQRNKDGVGAPGSWSTDGPLNWTPAPEPSWGNLQSELTPVRSLLPNEKLILWGLFSGTMVQRTDLQPAQAAPAPVAAGGGLTPQQDARLTAIFEWMQRQPQ